MADITTDKGLLHDVTLHVEDSGGDGRPVVLIHGWPLSGQAWSGQVPALKEAGYRVVTYDRRGFGRSDKPHGGYDYDTLADDLAHVLEQLDLRDVTLVGFSMGGGEVARYISRHGQDRLHSVVFASAVPPCLMQSGDNPDGPLTKDAFEGLRKALQADRTSFFDTFMTGFFSCGGELRISEEQRRDALALCHESDQRAAVGCMEAWATTDFRDDLREVTVPTLVLHGHGDETVPFEGSGRRTHETLPQSELVLIPDAPHGCNTSHPDEFNRALLDFLAR